MLEVSPATVHGSQVSLRRHWTPLLLCALLSVQACAGDVAEEDDAVDAEPLPTLLVDDTRNATFNVAVAGVLEVNERGCFTVNGDILVVSEGLAQADPDSGGLVTDDGTVIQRGQTVSGNGAVLEVDDVLLSNNPSWRACLPSSGRLDVFGLTAW